MEKLTFLETRILTGSKIKNKNKKDIIQDSNGHIVVALEMNPICENKIKKVKVFFLNRFLCHILI